MILRFCPKAITKTQSIILIFILIVSISGASLYFLWPSLTQQGGTIKIGILADLDMTGGRGALQGATLAAEQINAEGGILGKQIEILGEDADTETSSDLSKVSSALTRLLTYHKVDFVIGTVAGQTCLVSQDIVSDHKKILLGVLSPDDVLTERVEEDYEKYKYFFRISPINNSVMFQGVPFSTAGLRNITGLNKVGYLGQDVTTWNGVAAGLDYVLPEIYGFDLVYKGKFPPLSSPDLSSYFAAAEAAGTEILLTLVGGTDGHLIVKEWYDRQSPMIIGGINLAAGETFWEATDGKCIYTTYIGYDTKDNPPSSLTLPFFAAFEERWGTEPKGAAQASYTALRCILYDAIRRAGTTETEAVIEALEETEVDTPAGMFSFTNNHDVFVKRIFDPEGNTAVFQYQEEGAQVPVYPPEKLAAFGGTFKYPPWPGPWD